MNSKKVVVIGGGTGTTAVLSGLKQYDDIDITVIVSMTDDGGSNAVIRDEFGLLPLSDVRKSLIALSTSDQHVLRDLFTYRFDKGEGLKGHTIGNLMMMGLSELKKSELAAIEALSDLFQVKGVVLPVTLDHADLVAEYDDGTQVKSEHLIDEPEQQKENRITRLFLEPSATAYEGAVRAIIEADIVIAGPGDLYTTTLANIIVPGIAEAIQESKALFVFVNNLMTKKGQTHGMGAKEVVNEITRYAGRTPDIVLMHEGGFPEEILVEYEKQCEYPLKDDLDAGSGYRVVRGDLIDHSPVVRDRGDVLVRSLIRHDPQKLAKTFYQIIVQSYAETY